MHYYQFNIGDYHSHTSHLSELEDLAYRRLLDYYYLHELPIPNDIDLICRKIRMNGRSTDVQQVLNEFFILVDNSWVNDRADSEIFAYKGKKEQTSNAGKASARARSERTFNVRSTDVQLNTNHKPLTINQEQNNHNQNDNSTVTETVTESYRNGNNPLPKQYPQKTLPKDNTKDISVECLNYLNEKTERNYKPVKSNLNFIVCRLKEGFTKEDVISVIDSKCSQWIADDKMNQYLRPATLFNATKFSQYAGELTSNKPVNKDLEGML